MSQSQEPKKTISKREAIEALWRKHILHWKLDKNQMEMYNTIVHGNDKIVVIGCSRQIGKSFGMVVISVETCIKQPNMIVKFIAPKVKDIRRIISPLIKEIISDAPKDMRPVFSTQDNVFRFPNGSEIQLAGTDNGHAESIRGNKAHLCIIDEAGFCDDLDYIVSSILIPTTTTTKGKIVMVSTPSKSPDHPFMSFVKKAELDGNFIKKTIYDNPRLTEDDINMLAEALGGKDSVDFKREYLVEMIISEDDAVVPEFSKEKQVAIVKEWAAPPYKDAYVSMDIGSKDMTVVLLGYYDFLNSKLIIQDEICLSGHKMLTDNLAELIKLKETELWTHPQTGEVKVPLLRVADNNNLILLNDLSNKHGISFVPTQKDNADAALNNMRMLIRSERIIIDPKCKTLIFHLSSAIWNRARTSYVRSADGSHADAIDALSYMCRNVNFNRNPFPTNYSLSGFDHGSIFQSSSEQIKTPLEKSIADTFKINNPRKLKRW